MSTRGGWWRWPTAVGLGLAGAVGARVALNAGLAARLNLPPQAVDSALAFGVVLIVVLAAFSAPLRLTQAQGYTAMAVILLGLGTRYLTNYAVALDNRAVAAAEANLWHEALRPRLRALPFLAVGHWPVLRPEDRAGYAWLLGSIAVNAYQTGDLAQAERSANLAVSRCEGVAQPPCAIVRQVRAWLRRTYDPAGAREDVVAAAAYPDPAPAVPWREIALADIAGREGDVAGALALLDEAEARAGGPVTGIRALRARLLLESGRVADARRALDSAAPAPEVPELPVDFPGNPFELETDLYLREGNYREAERYATAFLLDLAPQFMWVPRRRAPP
jgi:tetratricopeptide (TPR) repeat protein